MIELKAGGESLAGNMSPSQDQRSRGGHKERDRQINEWEVS